jgi:hypothetical protein
MPSRASSKLPELLEIPVRIDWGKHPIADGGFVLYGQYLMNDDLQGAAILNDAQ